MRIPKRPLIILGAGAQLLRPRMGELLAKGIPIVWTWGAKDMLAHTEPLNVGGFGSCGSWPGNLAVQSADWICILGARMDLNAIRNPQNFAPKAQTVIHVDTDSGELGKSLKWHLSWNLMQQDLRMLDFSLIHWPMPDEQ